MKKIIEKNISSEWDDRAKSGYAKLEWVKDGTLLQKFLTFISPKKTDIAIDLGTGTGEVAVALAKHVQFVYGVDYSQKMLDEAEKMQNIDYICADIKNMTGFHMPKLNKIVARMVFHHITEDIDTVLQECKSMLTKGGGFYLCEGVPPTKRAYDNWVETNALLEKRLFNTGETWIKVFKRNGFKITKHKTLILPNLSTRKWLENRGESSETVEKVIQIRKNMSSGLKKDWNARVTKNDVHVDTAWFFLKASV